jgi:hypothetical protein
MADDPTGTSSSAMTGQQVGEHAHHPNLRMGPRASCLTPQASPHPRATVTADPLGGTAIMIVASAHPMCVDACLDPYLSRWLWPMKWHLAIPHLNVLAPIHQKTAPVLRVSRLLGGVSPCDRRFL